MLRPEVELRLRVRRIDPGALPAREVTVLERERSQGRVVAAPVRVSSAAVKVVPVAGDVVAAPLDVTADVID
ncbi:MAG: hypothetical protein Tsb0020_20220 [Haliangiales bacterium]